MMRKSKDWDKFLGPLPDNLFLPSSHASECDIVNTASSGMEKFQEAIEEEHCAASDDLNGVLDMDESVLKRHQGTVVPSSNHLGTLIGIQEENIKLEHASEIDTASAISFGNEVEKMTAGKSKCNENLINKSLAVGENNVIDVTIFGEFGDHPKSSILSGYPKKGFLNSLDKPESASDALVVEPSMSNGDCGTLLLNEELALEYADKVDHISSTAGYVCTLYLGNERKASSHICSNLWNEFGFSFILHLHAYTSKCIQNFAKTMIVVKSLWTMLQVILIVCVCMLHAH